MKWEESLQRILYLTISISLEHAFVERQTHKSLGQNRTPRSRTKQICPPDFDKPTKAIHWTKYNLSKTNKPTTKKQLDIDRQKTKRTVTSLLYKN